MKRLRSQASSTVIGTGWPSWFASKCSQQFAELFLGETRLADEGAECAFGEFAVAGDGQTTALWIAQDHVAAGLIIHLATEFSKGFNSFRTGTNRQAAHTETSTISSATGLGIGSPCFSKLWR